MSTMVAHQTTFTVLGCWVCGMQFAITSELEYALSKNGSTFHCPKGCAIRFGESEAERLKKQLAKTQAELDQAQAGKREAWQVIERVEREKAAVRGHLTRLKRRVANGVCPCCQRSFKNVRAHMKTQHPTYEGTELA